MRYLTEVLQHRARKKPSEPALFYLEDGLTQTASITNYELDTQARVIAGWLQEHNLVNQRILLIYAPGIDFVTTLIGCWYAGAVAVPVAALKNENPQQEKAQLKNIAQDAEIAAVFTQAHLQEIVAAAIGELGPIYLSQEVPQTFATQFNPVNLKEHPLAYLQYTSGSTSAPKAAMVEHRHLNHSLKETIKIWAYDTQSKTLTWAPHTHVYGLVCGLLVPLYHGTPAYIVPPAAFLQKPITWLQAIGRYAITHSGCPNFGYDVCVQQIDNSIVSDLDLSAWRVAVNGGDVVQQQTIDAFTDKFKKCGFTAKQFCSAYGMSELAGAIASTPVAQEPTWRTPKNNPERSLVSSGFLLSGLEAVLVDSLTGQTVAPGEIGEIWLAGKSVVSGYWRRPEENRAIFQARVPGRRTRFFRTGDLGFMENEELFLTGRLKEVLMVYGKKYYPLDFELTTAKVLKNFNIALPQAAFSATFSVQEEIVLVQEIAAHTDASKLAQIAAAIQQELRRQFGVDVRRIVFTPPGAIPKTASGKLQRKKCQQAILEQTLPILWPQSQAEPSEKNFSKIQDAEFLNLIAEVLGISSPGLNWNSPLSQLHLDSISIMQLTSRLNERYGTNMTPARLYEFSTLAEFYQELLGEFPHLKSNNTFASIPTKETDIAIIGMSGIFPQAADAASFWTNLVSGKDCIQEIPATRWDWHHKTVQWAGLIDPVDQFDASFFSISPREAALIDPQQRLFLQTVWKAIEDAGYAVSQLATQKTGLFVGVFNHDYAEMLQQQDIMDAYLTTGTMNSMIANRISFLLNLRGPSETIDTACSSSLVAIHQAVQAILHGDCELAIAGGVNLLLSPTSFVSAYKAGMLSDDGRCKTFDAKANGYVRGEGMGALLLKKLSQAQADGDTIYAVIKGTAVNHGGHVSSLTAPNPGAQAEAVVAACLRAQIPVDTVQYIETHGTGTPLGDPIEINGLKKAFKQLVIEQNLGSLPEHSCALGAVKTHIGHLESAAGIAGVIKTILAMQHELLPANLHLQNVNPYIELTDSPFYLLKQNTPWPRNPSKPRRAGVSSFGFGGANAHIILEESPMNLRTLPESLSPQLITLSAKTQTALRQKAEQLLQWLNEQASPPALYAIAFTLNTGREHFSERYAVVVNSHPSLQDQLKQFLSGSAQLVQNEQGIALHLQDLARRYLQGETLNWQELYPEHAYRIPLPTYPFAQESHWFVPKTGQKIHPLLDEQTAPLPKPVFMKRFSGEEFYLCEHQLQQEAVLPGAVCIEMIYAALKRLYTPDTPWYIEQLRWNKPISGHALKGLYVEFNPTSTRILVCFKDEDGQEYLQAQLSKKNSLSSFTPFDLDQEKSIHVQDASEFYTYFSKKGLQYGSGFQVVQQVRYTDDRLEADLKLPSAYVAENDSWQMHPGLLDGLFQVTQVLLTKRDTHYLPYALEDFHLVQALPANFHAVVERLPAKSEFPTFRIHAFAEDGSLLLSIAEFTLAAVSNARGMNYFYPQWIQQEITAKVTPRSLTLIGAAADIAPIKSRLGADIELQTFLSEEVKVGTLEKTSEQVLILLPQMSEAIPQPHEIENALQQSVYLVLTIIEKILQLKPQHPVEIIFGSPKATLCSRALSGLAKTVTLEQPYLRCRLVEYSHVEDLIQELGQAEVEVRYDTHRQRWMKEYTATDVEAITSLKLQTQGVYLITGGLGELGFIFASYLARHCQARLVLTGRSPLASAGNDKLQHLKELGAEVLYIAADCGDYEQVCALLTAVKNDFGSLQGVIHAAGTTADGFLGSKNLTDCSTVFAPKIGGVCHLHAATIFEPLDFFVLFSSVAAVFGNAGQSDYAYANAFLDEFAVVREQLRLQGQCHGKTLSINWPYWEEGGIKLDLAYQQALEHKLGIVSLQREQGIAAFADALQEPHPQMIVMPGYRNKLLAALNKKHEMPDENSSLAPVALVQSEVADYLKNLLGQALKISPAKIKAEVAFEEYGIDSLMILQLNELFEQHFSALPKTLFFEYRNLDDLTDYFLTHQTEKLQRLLPQTLAKPVRVQQMTEISELKSMSYDHQDIAIIGIHGRYPQARNLKEFWENLCQGKDCITEIPEERWSIQQYFTENKDDIGKTYGKWGGFIRGVDEFDPLFFNISPREAILMDPQERLFLQSAWSAVEDAGYAQEQLKGKKVGVYVGVMYGEYQLFAQGQSHYTPVNSVFSSIANRVSYFFDVHGPSMALDTMCSSSLTAIHLACNSIKTGECEMALAGGVNLLLHPNKYLLLSHGKFLASDGHCRSFGADGDGYVPGEGVGAVLLKPFAKALADGDIIHAVIKGSSLNHGGKTNGYTVPNPQAQAEVINEAYRRANLAPEEATYIEAHGTGTALGDPIEMAGLSRVFSAVKDGVSRKIGSVKANIGHCEAAAGIAAVSKVVLQMNHRQLVPSILAQKLNPHIDWNTAPFQVQQDLSFWDSPGPRIAGISSFGAGGANAHLILAEAPAPQHASDAEERPQLLVLSAKTPSALRQRLVDLLVWSKEHSQSSCEAVAWTLATGRTHFEYRCALIAYSIPELVRLLQQACANQEVLKLYCDAYGVEDLKTIAQAYLEGQPLPLSQLFKESRIPKISLPTYPFAQEHYWYQDELSHAESALKIPSSQAQGARVEHISTFILQQVKQLLNITQHQVQLNKNLGEYGMDSVNFVALAKRIANEYEVEFTPAHFYTYNSIEQISAYISKSLPQTERSQPVRSAVMRAAIRKNEPAASHMEVAVIGMSGLFPQAENAHEFWQHLIAGRDLITEAPANRWSWQAYQGKGGEKSQARWGGFIEGVDLFDAAFFNISAREAQLMDPQQRLFLETAWKTFEDAGYDPLTLSDNKIGVFAGVEFSEYQRLISKEQKDFHGFVATGNSPSLIANRVSYFFNLQGPSEAVATACSSSLVAIHRAIQSLRNGECSMALAGGVSLILDPDTVVITSEMGALSPEGRCKTFDEAANGYVKGEGVGSLLLKPLTQAQQDGDFIYAVIKGSAVNHGGKPQSLTAPNALAQSEVIVNAYRQRQLDPNQVNYIETHGTGTSLGDPVEIEGLKLAFTELNRSNPQPIGLGSVKTNIGHLEPASGIASVIKLILALKHETLPGIVHLQKINPHIRLADSPFYIVEKNQPWLRQYSHDGKELPLAAGVSSFGFGGTNAHLVIEEGRPYQLVSEEQQRPAYLMVLSAKTQESLLQKITALREWLQQQANISLNSLSFTLTQGRAHFSHRCALVTRNKTELLHQLAQLAGEELPAYSLMNYGQTFAIQGPVFTEIYQSTLNALRQALSEEQYFQKLFIMADLYIKHYDIAWHHLFDVQVPRLAGLPAYPFIKQRYWFDADVSPATRTHDTKTQTMVAPAPGGSRSILEYLQQIFAEKLRAQPDQIHAQETYELFGVDSLIGLEITNRLEQDFGTLPKTLLYEYNRLEHLARYFTKYHAQQLNQVLGVQTTPPVEPQKNSLAFVAPQCGQKQDIAIIGLSGMFPMAQDMDEFWENLVSGRDCVGEVPADRWNYLDYPVQVGSEQKYFRHGGFIPDVDKFDPLFFNISPRDAGLMDPQERLFLQTAWATLEDAGYTRANLQRCTQNRVGVFAGVTYNFYPMFIAEEWQKGNRVPLDIQTFSVANRLSYFLDLTGPSLVLDTACSSSLAAIHLACESILRGECAMAFAGGVNLSLHPSKYHFLGSFSFMSEQGRCTSFAEGGTGYVPAEGVGCVLLKPLEQALADKDRIYGVIKASSMNHGGKTSGYTVPNPNAQAEVVRHALTKAQLSARDISYVEAHGTGTALGDPIEVRGLHDAFSEDTQDKQYCALGSVKSNIGHLESAAGISQLAKVLLQINHKKLVPTLHTQQLNSFIDFAQSPFYVQRELSDWPAPRYAGVSSFGAGGANVHLIVGEHQEPINSSLTLNIPYLFVLSAQNEERLQAYAQKMYDYLTRYPHTQDAHWLHQACYTLQVGREAMSARLAILANTREELLHALTSYQQQRADNIWFNPQAGKNAAAPHLSLDSLAPWLEHWVQGAAVNWYALYGEVALKTVTLPTYPFAKRRCWIPTQEPVELAPVAPQALAAAVASNKNSEWFYAVQWEECHTKLKQEILSGSWLIVSDHELGLHIQNVLPAAQCIYCFVGEEFQALGENTYLVNPMHTQDFHTLFSQLQQHHQDLQGIIYLSDAVPESAQEPLTASLALLSLFQALGQFNWSQGLLFTLVTHKAQQVQRQDKVNYGQHPLWSMTRIFAAEEAQFQVLLLDVDEQEGLVHNAQNIVSELVNYQAGQNHIARRLGSRFVPRFVTEDLSAVNNSWVAPPAALVTGGLGALGYEVARALINQGTRYLLLTGTQARASLTPEKTTWLRQLQEQGAQIEYQAVDVADAQAMQAAIHTAEAKWSCAITGVFHLAGVTTDHVTLAQMDRNLWQQVLRVKVDGSLVLHELFASRPHTAFVLFSSIAAVPHFGMAGLSAYAVANEFMSGLAHHRRSQGLPALSINWVAWSEKGMSHRHNHDAFLDAVGMAALSIKEGMEIFNQLLQLNPVESTICKINWQKFFQVHATAKKLDFFHHFQQEYASSAAIAPSSFTAEEISQLVVEALAKALALETHELEMDVPFQQYGMDSIIGIHFTADLSMSFPDVVSPMDLYRYPTLKQLTEFIIERVGITEKVLSSSEELNLDKLSSEELQKLLEAELEGLEELTYE